jgi:NTP pyrophosphatase (non-canonical NTP hydrolase)
MELLTFRELDDALTARQKAWTGEGDGADLPVEFFAIELVGELGELFNVIKKLMRERHGVRGSRATQQDMEDEFGDVLICLKNMAAKYGVDLERVAREKFNATSVKYGFPHRVEIK